MKTFLRSKSVGGGIVQLLHEYCLAQHIQSPIIKHYAIDDRVTFDFWLKSLQQVYMQRPITGLGVDIGKKIQPSHVGITAYISQSCENLAQFFAMSIKYVNIWYNFTPLEIEWHDHELIISWSQPAYVQTGMYVYETGISQELMISILWHRLIQLIGEAQTHFNWVEFATAKPMNISAYELFQCPIRFGTEHTRVSLPISLLYIPLKQPDSVLLSILERQARQSLDLLTDHGDLIEQVHLLIINGLKQQHANIEWVAEKLNISARQLQKRLKQQERSFSDCLNTVKFRLAQEYLSDPNLSITDVAFLLSYNEVASFNRAFKTWTGITPSHWRQQYKNQMGN